MDANLQWLMASQAEMMKTIQSIQQSVSQLRQNSSSSSPSQLQQNSSSSSSPPSKSRRGVSPPPSSSALLNTEIITEATTEDIEGLSISPDYRNPNNNRRSFTHNIKQQCWEKAEKIKGRDPERWRRDPLGNTIFRKFVGCPGCLCHDYGHIVPYSQGGMSTLENCQVLQTTANRSKVNKTDISEADLKQKSSYCWVSGRDMDLLELSAYGNVRGQDSGDGCNIQ